MMKNQSTKYQARSQVALGFFFLIFLVSSQGKPNKLKVDSILSEKYEVEHLSQKMLISGLRHDQRKDSRRLIQKLYFDASLLNFEQKFINWETNGICLDGSNAFNKRPRKAEMLKNNPFFDIKYCDNEELYTNGNEFLIALNDKNKIDWKYSLCVKSKTTKNHKCNYTVVGISHQWVILYNDKMKEIEILSTLNGSRYYPFKKIFKLEFKPIELAAFDSEHSLLYITNKNRDNKAIELMQINLVKGKREILTKFPRELARFPFTSAMPMKPTHLMYLPKFNLLSIFLNPGYEGKNNSKFILFDINSEKMIFETEYPQYIRPLMISNKEGTSVGISYQKNGNIRIIDQYNISSTK